MSCSCSPNNCNCGSNQIELNFTAPVLDMVGLRVGRTYQFRILFKYPKGHPQAGQPYTIMADTFEMSILNAALAEVENLQVGSGFTKVAPNALIGVITPSTTGTAGKYTHTIIWTITASGAEPVASEGKIIVKT